VAYSDIIAESVAASVRPATGADETEHYNERRRKMSSRSNLNRSSIGSSKQTNSNKSTPAPVKANGKKELTKNARLDLKAAIVLIEQGTAMLKELVTTDGDDESKSGDDSSVIVAVNVTQGVDLSAQRDDEEDENSDGDGQHEPTVDREARFARKGPSGGLTDDQKKFAAKLIALGISKSVVAMAVYKFTSAQACNNLKACPSSEMPAFINELRADYDAGTLPERVMKVVQPFLFPETATAAAAAPSKPKADQYVVGMPASGFDVSSSMAAAAAPDTNSSSKKIATFSKSSVPTGTESVATNDSPASGAKRKLSDVSTTSETLGRPHEFEKMRVPEDVFKATVPKSARSYYEKPENNWIASFDGTFFWKLNDKFVVEFGE
jgi:hypothetical protein